MTPDPRNVRDSLLTAGYNFEEVERMLRAADGRIEEGLAAALHLMDYAADFRNGNTHAGVDEGDVMASRMIARLRALLPTTPIPVAGVAPPLPVGISYVSPRHVCEVPRANCWCAGLPGAGAG